MEIFIPGMSCSGKGADFSVLDRHEGSGGTGRRRDLDDDQLPVFSLCRWGSLKGPFEVMFRLFWDTYVEASLDHAVTESAAPFFAFRGLVVASPVWYPKLSIEVRRTIFRFIEHVLDAPRFDPSRMNEYCE
jgi:hypothetical protein